MQGMLGHIRVWRFVGKTGRWQHNQAGLPAQESWGVLYCKLLTDYKTVYYYVWC